MTRIKCWMCISVKREIKYFDWELENWSARFAANCTAVFNFLLEEKWVLALSDVWWIVLKLFTVWAFLPLWHPLVCLINPRRKWLVKPCAYKTVCVWGGICTCLGACVLVCTKERHCRWRVILLISQWSQNLPKIYISISQILLPDNSLSAYLVWSAANGDNDKYN